MKLGLNKVCLITKISSYYTTIWNDRVAPSFQRFQETNYIQSLQVFSPGKLDKNDINSKTTLV